MRNAKNLKVLFSLMLVFAVVSSMFMTVMAEPGEALIGEDAEIIAEAEVAVEEAVTEEAAEEAVTEEAVAEEATEEAVEEEFDAWGYIDGYSDNVTADENFGENLDKALTTAREEIPVYATWLSLLPPIIAIALALITKEVYSSLFIGIASGALLYANFNFTGTLDHLFQDGFISSVADSYNIGILVFLVLLGAMVSLLNKAGASAAFGRWAETNIKSRVGAQLASVLLGCLLFGLCTGLKVILGTSSPISAQLISMIPYVVTIIVLVLFVGKSHVPAANGKPYVKSK